MNSLGASTTPFASTTTERVWDNKDQNLETNKRNTFNDTSLYNRGDQDVFSLSQLKHVAPSSNIYGMVEPSPLTTASSQSSGVFSSGENSTDDIKSETVQAVDPFNKETKDEKGSSTIESVSNKTTTSDKSSTAATSATTNTYSQSVLPINEVGATKTLKEVGQIIQSQAQSVAYSIRTNITSDNILSIIVDSFLVLLIAFLLYFGIW